MNDRVGSADKVLVIVIAQSEARRGEITEENPDARTEIPFKAREFEMQLKRPPKTRTRLLRVARADEYVYRVRITREDVRREVRADIAGTTGEEYGHSGMKNANLSPRPRLRLELYFPRKQAGTLRRGVDSKARPSMRG